MQQEYILTNSRNSVSVTSLWFRPNKVIVLNNTSNPVYVRRGGSDLPDAPSADYVVTPATSSKPGELTFPTVSTEFAFFLPTSPPLSDTTQVVTIIIQGDGTLPTDFFEYRLNEDQPEVEIETAVTPNNIFVYNPTDSTIYLRVGGLDVPDSSNADITIFPRSYYVFSPFESYYYAASMDSPPAIWSAVIFLAKGSSQYGQDILNYPNWTLPGILIDLNPLPSAAVHAAFTFTVL